MALKDNLNTWWQDLNPRWRQVIAIGGLLIALMLVGSVLVGGSKPSVRKKLEPLNETNLMLPKGNNNTPEQLYAKIEAQEKETKALAAQLQQEKDARNADKLRELEEQQRNKNDSVTQDALVELKRVTQRLDDLEKRGPPSGSAPALNSPLPGYEASAGTGVPAPEVKPEGPKLRVTGDNLQNKREAPKRDEKPVPALSAGSFFEAILLNGMDAPTSATTQKNPVPTTLRIKTEAMLPNKYRVDIKECFVLASGYGSLSSERAILRTESISCVRKDGKIIESKVEGYIVGEDGRAGMRGRLVSKQGQMIAKTLVAGGLSGFAQAMTPQNVPQLNLNPGGTVSTQTADTSSILQTGVAKGFTTSANEVAKFYMEMAREMTPVVEVDAGRKVTIMLVKGFELK
ncbi:MULTISPECIES: TraB/VirB10 family protein [unclassified Pseudomonas]|uniref:TraB/VirB10 family protein n=1 Tax=unclassified Pseudomonas TaxID=196821 RepID=UPI000C86A94D|nr:MULTISPECIES: TraB/VirB10 family protein [unclassified Pseudomonas]PMV96451.1 conjugal transfer protein TraB [Pseudomonas sp. GW460-C8]PMW23359.1 conjugal transfer protein TraB [Pseudomonas sp. GW456-E6]PMW24165.1 conjugal transfer protein TraB [Pseudomonas sp. GW456-11-11-14-TSB2]PMW40059.1 conjugal transfer protein TraB [Pseudomonas sp. GW460-7]PMW41170.1 conjugal transfer protein TraB [Pseudomonas sp. FW305-3-2-15-A-R2A1]